MCLVVEEKQNISSGYPLLYMLSSLVDSKQLTVRSCTYNSHVCALNPTESARMQEVFLRWVSFTCLRLRHPDNPCLSIQETVAHKCLVASEGRLHVGLFSLISSSPPARGYRVKSLAPSLCQSPLLHRRAASQRNCPSYTPILSFLFFPLLSFPFLPLLSLFSLHVPRR